MKEFYSKIQKTLSGLSPEAVSAFILSAISVINMLLPMFGFNCVNVDNQGVYHFVSALFLIGTSINSMYVNFNVTDASVKAQEITDLLKAGELVIADVNKFIDKNKKK
jgi:SPP1 family holin